MTQNGPPVSKCLPSPIWRCLIQGMLPLGDLSLTTNLENIILSRYTLLLAYFPYILLTMVMTTNVTSFQQRPYMIPFGEPVGSLCPIFPSPLGIKRSLGHINPHGWRCHIHVDFLSKPWSTLERYNLLFPLFCWPARVLWRHFVCVSSVPRNSSKHC